jgi:hypothetical protein
MDRFSLLKLTDGMVAYNTDCMVLCLTLIRLGLDQISSYRTGGRLVILGIPIKCPDGVFGRTARLFPIITQTSAGAINGAGHGTGSFIPLFGPHYQKTNNQVSKLVASGSSKQPSKNGKISHNLKRTCIIGGDILHAPLGITDLSGGSCD